MPLTRFAFLLPHEEFSSYDSNPISFVVSSKNVNLFTASKNKICYHLLVVIIFIFVVADVDAIEHKME